MRRFYPEQEAPRFVLVCRTYAIPSSRAPVLGRGLQACFPPLLALLLVS